MLSVLLTAQGINRYAVFNMLMWCPHLDISDLAGGRASWIWKIVPFDEEEGVGPYLWRVALQERTQRVSLPMHVFYLAQFWEDGAVVCTVVPNHEQYEQMGWTVSAGTHWRWVMKDMQRSYMRSQGLRGQISADPERDGLPQYTYANRVIVYEWCMRLLDQARAKCRADLVHRLGADIVELIWPYDRLGWLRRNRR